MRNPPAILPGDILEDTVTITTRKAALSGLGILGAAALVLSGCAAAPEDGPDESAAPDFKACMVSDQGGFDDKSFNQLGKEGLEAAGEELGIETKAVESATEDDYAPNIEALVGEGCNLIVTVGFLLSGATIEAANANPDIEFAIVDDSLDADFDGTNDTENGKPILFNTAEAAFLSGYAAAALLEDRHRRHLRWHPDQPGHHLHGRLRRRRRLLQRGQRHRREGHRMGQGVAERLLHRRLRCRRRGQDGRSGSARPGRRRAPAGRWPDLPERR